MGENPKKKTARKAAKKAGKKTAKKATRSSKSTSSSAKGEGGDRWLDRHLWDVQPVRDVLVVVGIIALFWLGQKISIVTVPLLLAMLFAYLLEPVVRLLMGRTRLERRGSVIAILAAMVVFIVVPAAIGVTFGVVQGVGLIGRMANNATLVYESVDASRAAADARANLASMTTQDMLDEQASDEASEGELGDDLGSSSGDSAQPGGSDTDPEVESDEEPTESIATPGDAQTLEVIDQAIYDQNKHDLEQLQEEARVRRARVESDSGNAWIWLHDQLVQAEASGTLDAMFRVVRNWLDANADQLASSAATTGANVLQTTFSFLGRAFAIFFMVFLTAFFFFFMATGWPKVQLFVAKLIPDKNRELVTDLGGKFDQVINAFIRGRLTIAFIQSIVFTLGYFIIGVPAAFILGPIVAILSIVPYLASVGIPVSIVLLWFENHTGIRGSMFYVLAAPTIFYFIAQALDDYVWTPMIQGKSTGMSTPAILFASIAGGVLFGFFGLLVAIPLAACIKILLDEIFWPHFKAWTEGKTKDLLPFGRE